jgi:polyisoprenoid-binding protein YceI
MIPPRRSAAIAAVVLASFGLAAPAPAGESWTLASGDVRVRCRLTVGGSFDVVTSAISGTLGREAPEAPGFSGALRVDLTGLDSGISLRDRHLRETYLEVERGAAFREAILTDIRLEDPLPAGGGDHETAFSGTLSLHGVERAVEGEAGLRRRAGSVRVEARFSLSLADFEIPPPRYLGVGVRDRVRVEVTFEAVVEPSGELRE